MDVGGSEFCIADAAEEIARRGIGRGDRFSAGSGRLARKAKRPERVPFTTLCESNNNTASRSKR
jgi:hypothetical protein